MLEQDQQRTETPANAKGREEPSKPGPNRHGYDPVLWPPRT
jgi:hypothetical protein